MIVALTAAFLLTLELARRGLEPECPSCHGKRWEALSTRLHCLRCGWNGAGEEGQ
ncbi:MAG TPA: hypothetical protein VF167_02095 [Longimicrobiaceae bacterium]